MKNSSRFGWFRNISIAKKLYFVVGIMAVLIALELFTLWFAIHTLSSVRAYVGGEGLWSKSQKDAVYYLKRFTRTHDEKDYASFQECMKVPIGDHKTRLELMKEKPDWNLARQGFIEGRNHPDDLNGMLSLFRRFHNISYIHKAIVLWGEADDMAFQLIPIGEELHSEINSDTLSEIRRRSLLDQVNAINEKVTVLEDDFSFTLGEGSRWLENLVLKLLFTVALTVEISGLVLTISVSRSIQKGLNEILRASRQMAKGNFNIRAQVYSEDEIGTLANSFNSMVEELGHSTETLQNYARKLEQSNDSLEQFAYIASHDLQEPLRKISMFSGLLEDNLGDKLSEESKKFLAKILDGTHRMSRLIEDVLNFSKVTKNNDLFEETDLNLILDKALNDYDRLIQEKEANIKAGKLPVIEATPLRMNQLFNNLIGNALKFSSKDRTPEIIISSRKLSAEEIRTYLALDPENEYYEIVVKDNGIGFEQEHSRKIFVIFQRLNSREEYSGTGIGLALCQKIVQNHRGLIFAQAKINQGASFHIILPARQKVFDVKEAAILEKPQNNSVLK